MVMLTPGRRKCTRKLSLSCAPMTWTVLLPKIAFKASISSLNAFEILNDRKAFLFRERSVLVIAIDADRTVGGMLGTRNVLHSDKS